MNYASKGFYPRALPQPPRSFRHRGGANVIPLRRFRSYASVGPVIDFVLVAITAWIAIGAMLAIGIRSGQDIVGDLLRGWRWW